MKSSDCVTYSIVVPLFNEETVIRYTYKRLKEVMESCEGKYELIFVDDGSRDKTSLIIKELLNRDNSIKLIELSRNFGHQIAITAGIDYSSGKAVVIIDGDMQDPPELIPFMIEKWREGFDVIYGKRLSRKGESLFKRASASLFYRLLELISNIAIPPDVGDFRLIDIKVVDVMRRLREKNRYVRGLISWAGFRQCSIEYEREKRHGDRSKYTLPKMTGFALDAIVSFSFKPLRLASYLGFFTSLVGFIYFINVLYQKFFTDTTVRGWTSLISINLIFNGIILIILGIMGEYIGRNYDETKNRPLYVVRDKLGFREDESMDIIKPDYPN